MMVGSAVPFFSLLAAAIQTSASAPRWLVGSDGAYTNCPCRTNISATEATQGYGIGTCAAWDNRNSVHDFCNMQDRPRFCSMKWCFVDKSRCNRTYWPVTESLFVSYSTCGNIANLQSLQHESQAYGDLRAGLFVEKAIISSEADTGKNNLDVSLKHAVHILDDMGIDARTIGYQNLSQASRLANPSSSYSSCVYDIALGNLDMCMGDFWATDTRLALGVLFVHTYEESIILVVPTNAEEDTWLTMLGKPFKPFTMELWIAIFSALIVAGLTLAWFEHGYGEFTGSSKNTLAHFLYDTLVSLFAGLQVLPMTLSGRILGVGLAFFTCLCLATFTANTATALIAQAQTRTVADVHEALQMRKSICYSAGMQERIETTYPDLLDFGVVKAHSGMIMAAMEDGECEVALISDSIIHMEQARRSMCNYKIVGQPVFNVQTGYYVADFLFKAMAYSAAKKRFDGTWHQYKSELLPKSTCKKVGDKQGLGNSGFQRLKLANMLGAFSLLAVSGLLAICAKVSCYKHQSFYMRSCETDMSDIMSEMGHLFRKEQDALTSAHRADMEKLEAELQDGMNKIRKTRIARPIELGKVDCASVDPELGKLGDDPELGKLDDVSVDPELGKLDNVSLGKCVVRKIDDKTFDDKTWVGYIFRL